MSQDDRVLHHAVLEEPSAAIDEEGAEEVSREWLASKAVAKRLDGERDVNFRLKCDDGKSYLLKVSHPDEDPSIIDFQTKAMSWIESHDPEIPSQRIISARDGNHSKVVTIAGRKSVVRLLSYIEGATWHEIARPSEKLAASLGAIVARLNHALADFEHPAQEHVSLWDIKSAPEVAPLADHIPDPHIREIVRGCLSDYLSVVPGAFDQLPWQVIHGDVNPRNVIVSAGDKDIPVGIIDFGDMVYSPRIFDLAVLCAYNFDSDGWSRVKAAACAYNEINPLSIIEKDVLLVSIKCRLSIMLCIAYWRSKLYPENIKYIQRSTQYATRSLKMIAGYSPGQLEMEFANIFRQEPAA